MAITVNGQILRNLPEQVSKNTEDIIDLQEQSNNNEIRITALEGNAIALATFQDCTFTGTSSFQGPISSNSGFTFSGNGTVGGNLSAGGNLAVTGSSTFTGTVTASGNENVGGNLSVAGNLAVTGSITNTDLNNAENVLSGSSIVPNYYAYEGDLSLGNLPANLYCNYAHYRISNGKLSIALSFYIPANATVAETANASVINFNIPSSVGANLFTYNGQSYGNIANTMVSLVSITSTSGDEVSFPVRIVKSNNYTLYIQLSNSSIAAASTDRQGRCEFNFLF